MEARDRARHKNPLFKRARAGGACRLRRVVPSGPRVRLHEGDDDIVCTVSEHGATMAASGRRGFGG